MPQLLVIFVNVLAPVFLIVGLAYAVSKRLQLDGRTFSRIAYYVLTPAFVFNLISTAKIEAELATRMIGFITLVYAGSAARPKSQDDCRLHHDRGVRQRG